MKKLTRLVKLLAIFLIVPSLSFATDLAIVKTADKTEIVSGQSLTYSLAVGIGSQGTAGDSDATVTDMIPASMTITSATWTKDHPDNGMTAGDCSIVGNNVTCALGAFNNGVTALVTIVVVANFIGIISNTATVSGSIADPQDSNDNSSVDVTVFDSLADIVPIVEYPRFFNALAPLQVPKGGIYGYDVSVRNDGEATAENVRLTHEFPEFYDILDGRYQVGGLDVLLPCFEGATVQDCTNGLDGVTCSIPSIEPNTTIPLFCVSTPTKLEGTFPYGFTTTLESPGDSDPGNNEINNSLTIDNRSIVIQNVNVSSTPIDIKYFNGELEMLDAASSTEAKCQSTDLTNCLNQDRFQVQMDWRASGTDQIQATIDMEEPAGAYYNVFSDPDGQGTAQLIPRDLDNDSFYFFNNTNVDILVKILDGGFESGNLPPQNFWVFAGGVTNVEYTIQVTDTQDGSMRHYEVENRESFFSVEGGAPKSGFALGLVGFDVYGNPLEAVQLVANETSEVPDASVKIYENYPNPFSSSTTIPLELESPTYVLAKIVDLSGRTVKILSDGQKEAGRYAIQWEGKDENGAEVASGTYVIQIEANGIRSTKSVSIVR